MSESYKGTTHTHTEKKMGFQEHKPSRVFDDVSLDILALKSMQLLLFLLKFIIFFYYLDFPSCHLIRWQPVLLLLHAVIKTSFFSKKKPPHFCPCCNEDFLNAFRLSLSVFFGNEFMHPDLFFFFLYFLFKMLSAGTNSTLLLLKYFGTEVTSQLFSRWSRSLWCICCRLNSSLLWLQWMCGGLRFLFVSFSSVKWRKSNTVISEIRNWGIDLTRPDWKFCFSFLLFNVVFKWTFPSRMGAIVNVLTSAILQRHMKINP